MFHSLGLIGAIFFSSLFGAIVMSPIFYRIYIDNGWIILSIGTAVTDYNIIRFQIIYYFTTVGAALVAGVIAGIIAWIAR